MPLQASDVPALRAKHLDLLQARYHQSDRARAILQLTAASVLMLTGVLTLLLCVPRFSSPASILAILFIGAMEWLFITSFKKRDENLFSMNLATMQLFEQSSAAGFDQIPDFTTVFGSWHYEGDLSQQYNHDGAPRFYQKLIWGSAIKTLIAFVCLPLNSLVMIFGS